MKYKYSLIVLFLSTLFLNACQKAELRPQNYITPDYVYNKLDSSGQYAEQVLNNLYTYLPNGFNRIDHVVLGAATDDAIPSDEYNNINVLSESTLNAISYNPDGIWYDAYEAIRNVNLFLKHVGDVPVGATTKTYW